MTKFYQIEKEAKNLEKGDMILEYDAHDGVKRIIPAEYVEQVSLLDGVYVNLQTKSLLIAPDAKVLIEGMA